MLDAIVKRVYVGFMIFLTVLFYMLVLYIVIKRPYGNCYQSLSMFDLIGSVRTVAVPLFICFGQIGK